MAHLADARLERGNTIVGQGVTCQEDVYNQERLKGEMAGIAYVETMFNGQLLEDYQELLKRLIQQRDEEIEDGNGD